MLTRRQQGSRALILIVGGVLFIYLATLIGFAYLGQLRLREALIAQERLELDKQAASLRYALAGRMDALVELSEHPQVQTLFADRRMGMSMQTGLAASLAGVDHLFAQTLAQRRDRVQPVFDNISIVEANGHVLLGIGEKSDAIASYHTREVSDPQGLDTRYGGERTWLVFSQPIAFEGQAVGLIVAETDASRLIRPFLDRHAHDDHLHQIAFLDTDGRVIDSSSPGLAREWRLRVAEAGETLIESPVFGTPFRLISLPNAVVNEGIVTSPWFLAALGLMGLALLAGAVHVWRLNSHNLVLRTHYESTAQQRTLLSKQNALLQREINKRVESEQKLTHQANYDQLTGLPNRNLALDRLAQTVKWAKRELGRVQALFVDLDRFKQVNDSLGHAAGDELLREAAQRLKSSVRDSDTVSRLGGDEFLVICPETAGSSDWERCAEQMLKVLSAPFYIGDHEFFVGASIGVAVYPDAGTEPDKLLKNADIAMYAAKEKGRNRFCRYDPSMDAMAMEGMRLERNLRHALKRDEFYLMYQPIVDLSSGRTVAVEALLRWRSEELGEVDPERFIPIAEETGLVHEIGEWVLQEACHNVSKMGADSHFRLAINLSSKQFSRPARLLECVLSALRDSGLMPNQLELEITETILIDDRAEIHDLINQLDRIGVRLSIDDFGTGYSALNYLQRFPFDVLKIDRSFTNQVPDSAANVSLIRAIIAMAHALDLEVVAEGIESREQAGFLLVYHCEYGQGYHYSRPMMADQLRRHLIGDAALSA